MALISMCVDEGATGPSQLGTGDDGTTMVVQSFIHGFIVDQWETANTGGTVFSHFPRDERDITADVTTGNQYLYDAEGRICAVATPAVFGGQPTLTGYMYDADGARVAKGTITTMSCDPTTNGFQFAENYVLGPGGEELSMLDGTNTWQRTNVYAGGKLIGTNDMATNESGQPIPALHFHLEDALGTRRMQVSGMVLNLGQPETDMQSLPFGDGLATYADPLAAPTADDATPLHFTGKERDTESGNDYFGARYYASSMGRWLSPDWSAKREPVPYAKLDNPQSLNLYAYVFNNPLIHIDADGHATWFDPSGKKIGTDGVNDGGVVIAKRDSVVFSGEGKDKIIDMASSGLPMYSFSKEEIGAMRDSVARTLAPSKTGDMKGGFHEEGFTEKGNTITPAAAGPGYKPGDSEAHVNVPIGPDTTLVEHTHPSGSDATFGGTKFDPMPSGTDLKVAASSQFLTTRDPTFVQVNAGNSDAHVYDGSGVKATFNLNSAP